MKDKLDKLREDYPELYDKIGFECGDGWEPLLRKLSEQLIFLAKVEEVIPEVKQVKEKFGTLRFYADNTTDIMDACTSAAESRSAHICEVCGEYGKLRGKGWVKTLCKLHCKPEELTEWEKDETEH